MLASKVAARFARETLSKEWLMGVRRGWLAVMKPSIQDFKDVLRAHDTLDAFVERLKDQVLLVRRGPYSSLENSKERKRLDAALKKLMTAIDESRSRANHWKEWLDGTALGIQWGEDRSADAREMLALYKRDFTEATGTSIEGRGQKWRAASLVELMDAVLKILRDDAKVIQRHDERNDEKYENTSFYKNFNLGRMRVVVNDQTVGPHEIQQYIKYLDFTRSLLKKKGFEKLWRGEVFVDCENCGGSNPYGAELGVGGHYKIGPDTISIFSRPSKGTVVLMLHELGHRWWFRHMTRESRLRFEEWIDNGLAPVSTYGSKHHAEAFAEAFMHYCLGRPMTPQQVETFKLVALGKRFASAKIVDRYRTARSRLSGPLQQAAKSMRAGEWGGAEKALRAVLDAMGVSHTFRGRAPFEMSSVTQNFSKVQKKLYTGSVKQSLRDFARLRREIDKAVLADDAVTARTLFIELGESLKPLATSLDGVKFQRRDEQRKMKNAIDWLRRLRWPFEPKFVNQGDGDALAWISQSLDTIDEALKSLARIEGRLNSYQQVEREFKHGGFTVVNKFGFRPDEYDACLKLLDDAADKLRAKGFGKAIYGEVLLSGEIKGVAGIYRKEGDYITLNMEARNRFSDLHTLVHELGHRWWHKMLSPGVRDEYEDLYSGAWGLTVDDRLDMFQALVKGSFSPKKAIPYLRDQDRKEALLAWFDYVYGDRKQGDLLGAHQKGEGWVERHFVRPSKRKVVLDGAPLVTVTDYARTNVSEDFAETFAHYVLGMRIPPEVLERWSLVA